MEKYALYWDEYKLIWVLDDIPVWYVFKYYKNNQQNTYANQDIWNYSTGIRDYNELMYAYYGLNIHPAINIAFPSEHSEIILQNWVKNINGLYHPTNPQTATSSTAIFPTVMEVDYVRVYANRSCDAWYFDCQNKQLPSNIAAGLISLPHPQAGNNCEIVVQMPGNMRWPGAIYRMGKK